MELTYNIIVYQDGDLEGVTSVLVDVTNKDEVRNLRWLHQQPTVAVIPPLHDDGTINRFGAEVLLKPEEDDD